MRTIQPAVLLPALLLIVSAFLTACAPDVYRARVEASLGEDGFEPTAYRIERGQQDIDPSGHDFRRHAQALAAELDRRGFVQAAGPELAHITILLRFGLVGEKVPHLGRESDHLFVLDVEALDAIDLRMGRPRQTVWKITATAHGHLDQRHVVFKALLAAAAPYLGQSGAWDVRVHREPASGAFELFPAR